MSATIIFGGSGFIGTHMSQYLIENNFTDEVYCVDIKPPRYTAARLKYICHDVRTPFKNDIGGITVIYNFAAVHTTPGHPDQEYFETNIKGAENICDFARQKNISKIVFTSSISPYGPSEELKNEDSLPQPKSAYGSSKLAAEYIHRCWQAESAQRKLVIVRPGVVFGKGEGGNLTRLYDSLKKGYFFYPGRKDTGKASIYVKDIVRAMYEMSQGKERCELFNMCYPQPPKIQEIVKAICDVTGTKEPRMSIPGWVLIFAAKILSLPMALTGNKSGIHPERVKKLMLSTNISGEKLARSPYAPRYPLKGAIEDWFKDCDKQGLF